MVVLRWIAVIVLLLGVAYFGAAIALVHWPEPDYFAEHEISPEDGRVFREFSGVSFRQDVPYAEGSLTARDGTSIYTRRYGGDSDTVIVYVHGLGGSSEILNTSAGLLRSATGATIVTPDLRGHGQSGGRPFDLDYIGQHEDDVADLIAAIRSDDAPERVILAGHSMGGGIALRYALKDDMPDVDGYLLFAPNFGQGPTQRQSDGPPPTGQDAYMARAFVQFNTQRFIGLTMLNMAGITAFNNEPVLYMNQPPEMPAYSFAAIATAQPSPPNGTPLALQAIDTPLLILIGANDELFDAGAYAPLVAEHNPDAETVVVPGLSHSGLINTAKTFETVETWYDGL